jgi:hypothetical protein
VILLQVQTKFFLAVNASVLLDLKLRFGDMADHGILHRQNHGLPAEPWSSIPVA